MGLVPPRPGYLETLRELTEKHGTLLVFDEVMTGFRVAYGGAQALYGITPDLTALGKIIGGGLPAAAYGASAADHGPRLARRADLPGGHALGQSPGDGRRPDDPATRSATSPPTSGSKRSRPGWPRASSRPPPTPGSRTSSSASGAC